MCGTCGCKSAETVETDGKYKGSTFLGMDGIQLPNSDLWIAYEESPNYFRYYDETGGKVGELFEDDELRIIFLKHGLIEDEEMDSFNAEKEGMYFVFADGKTMIELEDLEWKIPYSEIRDYVNEWTDNLKEDQEWRLNPYDVAYDFAYDKWEDEPYGMNWAENIRDAVNSRIWSLSDNYNDVVDLDELMTKAEIRSFLTGIDSRNLTKKAETFESVNQSITSNKIGESLAWDNRILGMAGQWRNGKYDINSIRQDADIIGYTIVHEDYLEKKLDWMENGVNLGSKDTDIAEINFAGMKIYTGGDGSFPVMGIYENINDYYARTQNKPHPRGNMTMMEFFDQEDYEKGKYEEKKWEYEFVEWVKETYKPAPTYYEDGSPMVLYHHVAEKIGQENIPKLLVGARLSLHNPSMPTLNRRDSKSSIWVLEVPDLTHLKTTKYKQNYRGKTEVFINTETTVNKFFSNLKAIYPKGDFLEGSRNNRYKQFTINIPSFGEYRWNCHEVMLAYDSVSQSEEKRREGVKRQKDIKKYRLLQEEEMKALKERYGAETFEAAVIRQGKAPKGAMAKAMMNKAMMEQANIEAVIQELENKVNLGLISEGDLMASLKKKFGAEYDIEELSNEDLEAYFADLKKDNPKLAKIIEFKVKNEEYLPKKMIEDSGYDYEILEAWNDSIIDEDKYTLFDPCPACEGEGWRMTSYTPATRFEPADGDGEDCGDCGGSGKIDPSDYMYYDDKTEIQYAAETYEAQGKPTWAGYCPFCKKWRTTEWSKKYGGDTVCAKGIPDPHYNSGEEALFGRENFARKGGKWIRPKENICGVVLEKKQSKNAETKKRKAGIRKCSKCGDYNHNAPNCNRLNEYEEYLKHKDEMLRQCDRAIDEFTRDAKEYSEDGEYGLAKMTRSDATDMKKLKRMIEKNHFGKATHFAMEMDSQPRDLAPSALWLFASEEHNGDY